MFRMKWTQFGSPLVSLVWSQSCPAASWGDVLLCGLALGYTYACLCHPVSSSQCKFSSLHINSFPCIIVIASPRSVSSLLSLHSNVFFSLCLSWQPWCSDDCGVLRGLVLQGDEKMRQGPQGYPPKECPWLGWLLASSCRNCCQKSSRT